MTKLLLVLAVSAIVACQQAHGATRPPPPPTPKYDCAKMGDFTKLHTTCCNKPVGNLGLDATLAKCNNKKKDLNQWINNYMLYKFQVRAKNNTVELNTTANIKLICSIAPFVNCVFNVTGILTENGTFNTDVVKTLLSNNKDETWQAILEGISEGVDFKEYIPPMFANGVMCTVGTGKNAVKKNVSVAAVVLVQYLQMTIVNLCPEPKTETTGAAAKCAKNLELFSDCRRDMWENLFPQSAPGVQFSATSLSAETNVFKLWKTNPKAAVKQYKEQLATKKSG